VPGGHLLDRLRDVSHPAFRRADDWPGGCAGDAWRVTQGTASLTDGAIIEGYALLPAPLPASILAMVVTAAFLWLLRELFSRLYGQEAMGFGDVFLVAGIAANIGWSALLGTFFFLSIMLGAIIGVTLRIPRAVRAYRWARARAAKAALRREQTDAVAANTQQTTVTDAVLPVTATYDAATAMEGDESLHGEFTASAVDSSEGDGPASAIVESVDVEVGVVQGTPFGSALNQSRSNAVSNRERKLAEYSCR
jgi:hypothetical protein